MWVIREDQMIQVARLGGRSLPFVLPSFFHSFLLPLYEHQLPRLGWMVSPAPVCKNIIRRKRKRERSEGEQETEMKLKTCREEFFKRYLNYGINVRERTMVRERVPIIKMKKLTTYII